MQNINKVVVVGNICHDVSEKDFGFIGGGDKALAKLSFSIAVNDSKKINGEYENFAYFFDVTLFGKMAETLKPYIAKGKTVAVDGKLVQDRWEKDGQKFSKIYIKADYIQLLGGGKGKSNDGSASPSNNNLGFPEDIPTANDGELVF